MQIFCSYHNGMYKIYCDNEKFMQRFSSTIKKQHKEINDVKRTKYYKNHPYNCQYYIALTKKEYGAISGYNDANKEYAKSVTVTQGGTRRNPNNITHVILTDPSVLEDNQNTFFSCTLSVQKSTNSAQQHKQSSGPFSTGNSAHSDSCLTQSTVFNERLGTSIQYLRDNHMLSNTEKPSEKPTGSKGRRPPKRGEQNDPVVTYTF